MARNRSVGLSLIAALVAIWTGLAWYSGKRAEKQFGLFVDAANVKLADLVGSKRPVSHIEVVSYERGVFSSTATYRVRIEDLDVAHAAGLERDFVVVNHMQHGPYPLSHLMTGAFAPALSAGRYSVEQMPAGEKPALVRGTYDVSFSGTISTDFGIAPLNLEQGAVRIAVSSVRGTLTYLSNANQGAVSLATDGVSMSRSEEERGIRIAWRGVTLDGDITAEPDSRFKEGLNLHLVDWTQTVGHEPATQFNGTTFSLDLAQAGRSLDADIALDFGKVTFQGMDLGGLKLVFAARRLDAEALGALNRIYMTASERARTIQNEAHTADLTPEEMFAVRENIALLLAGNPTLAVRPFELRSPNGTSTVNLNLELTNSALPGDGVADALLRGIRELSVDVLLSRDNLRDLFVNRLRLLGVPEAEAIRTAGVQVDQVSAMGVQTGLGKIENEDFVSRLKYEQGQVTLNTESMPSDQFIEMMVERLVGRGAGRRD